jgi:flavin-dependent dehydrogenase
MAGARGMVTSNWANPDPQVIVIGGGPAGATTSTILAQQGVRVLVLEREQFPRFHIGESLIPETYWTFRRLGMLPKLKRSQFVRKESVQFVNENGRLSEPFYFTDYKPGEQSQTWQVRRSEFDQMMLDNAREHGADVREGVRVLDVLFDGDRARGVRLIDENGVTRELAADVIVDASGQTSLIASRLKLRVIDTDLKKGSVWTYFEGARRDAGRDEGATLILQTKGKQGWFWYIPLHDNIVSVGVVASFDYLFRGRGEHEAIFNEELDRCPAAKERLSVGRRVTGFFATRDFSYKSLQVAGRGWVAVGDAFGFLDPLYSSGVLLALRSGELAADAIVEGLAKEDLSGEQLGRWAPEFQKGMDRMRRLVVEFYDGFNFGRFIKRNPHLKGPITDLLIGDMFRGELDIINAPMDEMRVEMERERAAKRSQPAA